MFIKDKTGKRQKLIVGRKFIIKQEFIIKQIFYHVGKVSIEYFINKI